MVEPEPALAPVILPVLVPIVQLKLLGIEADNPIFGDVPLHVVNELGVVTTGAGLTVTTIAKGAPAHVPVVAVGMTKYSTVPTTELLVFVRV